MRTLLLFTLATLGARAFGQIVRDDVYARDGFRPYWELGNQPAFDCVGKMKTAGGGTGVWLGGPYVLYVAHGTGTWGKGNYQPTPASKFIFTLVKDGQEYDFQGLRWHIPKASYQIDESTQEAWKKRPEEVFNAFDFCVLELAQSPHVPGVNPCEIQTGDEAIGLETIWCGFGERGIASTGSSKAQFGHGGTDKPVRKLAWQSLIDAKAAWGSNLFSHFRKEGYPLEGFQAAGSSGGGVFTQTQNRWVIVGLSCGGGNQAGNIDWVPKTGSMYGARARAQRIAFFRDELLAGLAGNWNRFESLSTARINILKR